VLFGLSKKNKMKSVLHKADSRGVADHGWLKSFHSFSFANYYNPDRMSFGALRVLNDDTVDGGAGFGAHPHQNMEIVSIPLEGDLEHRDSMGNLATIKSGDVQVMSAGTGVTHSEYNKNNDTPVKFLQIWVIPNKQNVEPRYDQIVLDENKMNNQWLQILSPNQEDEGVWVHQDAWFHMSNLEVNKTLEYDLKQAKTNGVYVFLLNGALEVDGQKIESRDAVGIWGTAQFACKATENSRVLIMEVPMQV
jgi:redox-sensitive bicupin YhaK (pirin superfamily)